MKVLQTSLGQIRQNVYRIHRTLIKMPAPAEIVDDLEKCLAVLNCALEEARLILREADSRQDKEEASAYLHDLIIPNLIMLYLALEGLQANFSRDEFGHEAYMNSLDHFLKHTPGAETSSDHQTSAYALVSLVESVMSKDLPGQERIWVLETHGSLPVLTGFEIMQIKGIILECLNNSIKHSGSRHVHVRFDFKESEVSFSIKDYGSGFDVRTALHQRAGRGLETMRSRAMKIFGVLEIEAEPGGGCLVRLSIPRKGNP